MKVTAELPISVLEPAGEFMSLESYAEMAGALERAGVDAGFITDHPAPDAEWLHSVGHDALDPFAAAAFIAAASTKLMVHTNIVVLPYRSGFVTAKAAATVQALSRGRLILGVGVGYQKAEFDALGIDYRRRGAISNHALEDIRKAWAGGAVTVRNSGFDAATVEARPVPNPPPPIWVGGASPKAIERAARWADGWCPFYSNPGMGAQDQDTGVQSMEHLKDLVCRLQEQRAAFGRTGAFDVVLGPRMRVKRADAETAERFLQSVDELRAAGVTWATANIAHPSRAAYVELVDWFGAEIVARLR
jgi:probable F420-dependent oxidoreductase